jgi:hypothetical protein
VAVKCTDGWRNVTSEYTQHQPYQVDGGVAVLVVGGSRRCARAALPYLSTPTQQLTPLDSGDLGLTHVEKAPLHCSGTARDGKGGGGVFQPRRTVHTAARIMIRLLVTLLLSLRANVPIVNRGDEFTETK